MRTTINGFNVEWDAKKDKTNFLKHGISFRTAALVFVDANRVESYDYVHSEDEDRFIVIGMVDDIITVVYTERSKATRIISARYANAAEKGIYYGKNS